MKFFLRDFQKKNSNIEFHGNPTSGNQVVPTYGRTNRHDEADNRFSQFFLTRLTRRHPKLSDLYILYKANMKIGKSFICKKEKWPTSSVAPQFRYVRLYIAVSSIYRVLHK